MMSINPLRDELLLFRKLLWFNHGCPISALYGDDGEMQCNRCGIDFKRDNAELIEIKLSFKRAFRPEGAFMPFVAPKHSKEETTASDKLNDSTVQKESVLCKIKAELEKSAYSSSCNPAEINLRINKLYILMGQLVEYLIEQG